ncbi:MAG: PocR ligand-binding domain-containing protein [Treponema sp.]|nr:PocR ligand-binding domain-containing protein [Treponema sp.]
MKDGIIPSMKVLDVFLEEKAKKLISSFSHCFKVCISIFSADVQKNLTLGFNPLCNYCTLVRGKLHYDHCCIQMDHEMCLRSTNSLVPLVYPCHAGLVDVAFPIKLNDEVVGYAMIGQFRTRNTIPPTILHDWGKNGFDPAVLNNAFTEQPLLNKTSQDGMINLFSMLCDYIICKGYIRTYQRQLDITEEVLRWIENHISAPMLFRELADHLGFSQSTILNALNTKLHISFKQLCILKKIERFESIVTTDPLISIEEAALKVGYHDVSYFSRLYKKVRSTTPSLFIKSISSDGKPAHINAVSVQI